MKIRARAECGHIVEKEVPMAQVLRDIKSQDDSDWTAKWTEKDEIRYQKRAIRSRICTDCENK